MAGRLEGKKAFITGGAQGLGYAFAKMFLAEGARVVITDIQSDKVAAANQELGGDAGLAHDVTDAEQWSSTLARANATMGGINVLIHNAGIASWGSIETESYENYRKIMAVDTDSVFLGSQAALPYMKENAPGSIVVISSVAGLRADRNMVAYNTAKAAVAMMSKSIALHCAKSGYNIRCNSVHPVFTRTPIIDGLLSMKSTPEEGEAALSRNIPMKRLGEPEDIANMVTYLASDESGFVTGTEFVADGGITAQG